MIAREIRNEAEAGNAELGLRPIEFGDDVGCPRCFSDDNHRAKVARLCLAVQGLFDSRVPDEDKCTGLEVEVDNTRPMPFLELLKVSASRVGDEVLHPGKVFGSLRQLTCADSDKLFGRNAEVLGWSEIGSFVDIERKEGVNTVDHVVGGVAGSSSDSNSLSPEDLREYFTPLRLVA